MVKKKSLFTSSPRVYAGTESCPRLVLVSTQSWVSIVSRISITRPAIRSLNANSYGWHDLAVWAGGGIQPGYEADVPVDGECCATNPTVPPAHELSSRSAGRVVISDSAATTPLAYVDLRHRTVLRFLLDDRADHLALSHRREARWWWNGGSLQSRGSAAPSLHCPEVPADRSGRRSACARTFSTGSPSRVRVEPPQHLHHL